MMLQSNALRKLEELLTEAVENGEGNEISGPVLLRAMKLSDQPKNLVGFYELLNKAEEEARNIRNIPNLDRYLQAIEELQQIFVLNHVWNTTWVALSGQINSKGILNTLDAPAHFFSSQNPKIFLEKDFLEKLNGDFRDLLAGILGSDLSKELKRVLIEGIEDILKAIRRYYMDGTEGLEKATKSLMSDLLIKEHSLKDEDKSSTVYKEAAVGVLTLLMFMVGAVPDIDGYWIPKYEELVAGRQKIEKIVCETPTIQEAVKKASNVFNRQPQKNITGSGELKALPASK